MTCHVALPAGSLPWHRRYYPRRARSASAMDTVFTLDVCLYVCLYVCYRSRKKTLDRNDLKLGTVVLLNSPPKPIDFGPNRFRGKGAGEKTKFGTPSISLYRMKLHSSNLVCTWILCCSCPQTTNWPPKWAWPGVRAQF